jgi:(4S)-4-hydroxy-5-phosphonooxypentane-2,3-dione isomerase
MMKDGSLAYYNASILLLHSSFCLLPLPFPLPTPLARESDCMKTACMLIVHVHVQVKPESVADFIEATTENARNSLQEPGIARFDVVQQSDDPTRFILVEAYRDEAATKAHKETGHYAKWRDTVASMMSAPRSSVKFANLFPEDRGW